MSQDTRRLGRVTLADVAQLAGVDRSVVSRVVNGDPILSIRPATRARVSWAIAELGYQPNAAARSLRTSRTGTYGLFIPDYENPVYAQIIKGAEAAAAERGCCLVTGSAGPGREASTYLKLLGEGRVDGLLIAGIRITPRLAEQLDGSGVPWILLNQRFNRAKRYVILDDESAAKLAVDHLVALGHRRIAHLAGPPEADTARRRHTGYLAAMRAAKLPRPRELTVQAGYTPDGGADGMRELLSRPEPPTAVFVANVASAIGALHAARSSSVRVPQDLSVVAVHDLPLAGYLSPPLTTVRMPLEQLGRRGVDLLGTLSPDDTAEEVVQGPMELIVRESTGHL